MPEFMLTDPSGKTYKLTTPDGVTHEEAEHELARTMTHQAEQPNPAEPYLKGAKDFARGGVSDVLRGAGVQMPQASNAIGDVLKSDAANTAIGMVNPTVKNFRTNQFKTPGASANADVSSFSPSRTRASVEAELRDAHANIQGYKDAIARMPAGADSSHLYDDLAFEHQIAERLGKELSGQSEAGKVLGFHAAPAALERLPQPPLRQRVDRPINQQTLDEMRAAKPEPPPVDPRPINPETLAEMRANDPLGNGPLAPVDPLR
jgi:hypothetical protein